jgi:hypothetical protein
MGTLYAYRDHQPVLGAGTVLFQMAKGTGDVVIGEDTLIGAGVKIIGDSHGPARIGSRRAARHPPTPHRPRRVPRASGGHADRGPGSPRTGTAPGRGRRLRRIDR